MRKYNGEAYFCGFMLLSSAFYLIASLKVPFGSAAKPGPGFLPTILGIIAITLSVFLLIQALRAGAKAARGQGADGQNSLRSFVRMLVCLSIIILFVLALEKLGVIISIFLLTFSLSIFLGLKRWLRPILLSAAFSASIYVVFIHWLNVPLNTWPIWF